MIVFCTNAVCSIEDKTLSIHYFARGFTFIIVCGLFSIYCEWEKELAFESGKYYLMIFSGKIENAIKCESSARRRFKWPGGEI